VLAEELGLGHDHQLVGRESYAARQLAGQRQRAPSRSGQRLREGRAARRGLDAMACEERLEPLALHQARRHDDETVSVVLPRAELRHDVCQRALRRRRAAERQAVGGVGRGARPVSDQLLETLDLHPRASRQHGPQGGWVDVEPLRRRKETPVVLCGLGVARHLRPGQLDGRLDAARAEDQAERPLRQIVGEGTQRVVEVGQHELDPRDDDSAAHRLGQLAALLPREPDLGRALVHQPRGTGPQPGATELLHGKQQDLLDPVERAL
jgi:hypothetical protein